MTVLQAEKTDKNLFFVDQTMAVLPNSNIIFSLIQVQNMVAVSRRSGQYKKKISALKQLGETLLKDFIRN